MLAEIPANPQPLFTRIDPQVDFSWWDGAPRADMNDDNFGVRWTGFLAPPVTGKYQLGAIGMNAFELYLDGKRGRSRNNIHESRTTATQTVELEAGKLYPIRLDYHEVPERCRHPPGLGAAGAGSSKMRPWTRRGRPMPWCCAWGCRRAWKARR